MVMKVVVVMVLHLLLCFKDSKKSMLLRSGHSIADGSVIKGRGMVELLALDLDDLCFGETRISLRGCFGSSSSARLTLALATAPSSIWTGGTWRQ